MDRLHQPPVPLPLLPHPLPSPVDPQNRFPSVLTSDVYNEAEVLFSLLEDKEWHTVSLLDIRTLMRGIGMNPVEADLDYLREVMAGPIAKLEEQRLEEERRRERERKKEEAHGKKIGGDRFRKRLVGAGLPSSVSRTRKTDMGSTNTSAVRDTRAAALSPSYGTAANERTTESADPNNPRRKRISEPEEERKNIDWTTFIRHVEPIYRDVHMELGDVLEALKFFDSAQTGKITRNELIRIVTTDGESILSPAEVKQLGHLIPEEVELVELAHRLQGTYVPPSEEELGAPQAEQEARGSQDHSLDFGTADYSSK